MESNETALTAAADTPAVEDVPMGQSAEREESLLPEDASVKGEDEELFGKKGGYFHPYLSLERRMDR